MEYRNFIIESLKDASQIALRGFGGVTEMAKAGDNNQVLTQTDLEIGKFLIGEIEKQFSDHNIIDEEAGVIDKKSKYTWVIDPIDGTSNFANGLPTYGAMFGLLEDDVPIAGGISLPAFGQIYSAEKGKGAFCNGHAVRVTQETRLLSCLVAYGIDGHQENPELTKAECEILSGVVLGIRNLRSSNSVFDLAMVAKGSYGAFLNQTSKIWDNVSQQIIVEEAGGIYTDFWGNPVDYADPLAKVDQNYTFCAAPAELHRQLQEIIRSVPK